MRPLGSTHPAQGRVWPRSLWAQRLQGEGSEGSAAQINPSLAPQKHESPRYAGFVVRGGIQGLITLESTRSHNWLFQDQFSGGVIGLRPGLQHGVKIQQTAAKVALLRPTQHLGFFQMAATHPGAIRSVLVGP